ncbi:MAG: GNAT family N-acetyltransferase [Bacteroidetes bacterium]|nr:GNAT family N-acetyltransferase [Bacteroidota bacterium]
MELIIRIASKDDVEVLSKMGAEIFYETYAVYNTEENMQQYIKETYSEEAILNELSENGSRQFIATLDNEPVGYVKISTRNVCEELAGENYFEIERLYVYGKYQGQKIGYGLINACAEIAQKEGYSIIWLGVWEHNAKAIRFYEKMGFVKFGQHVFKLGNDLQNDFLMKLEIQ